MISITGNLLSGSNLRADHFTLVRNKTKSDTHCLSSTTNTDTYSTNKLDQWGRKPLISTLSGCARIALGLVHTIGHLALALFNRLHQEYHLNEAKLGLKNVAKGAVESVPLIGNLIVSLMEAQQIKHMEDEVRHQILINPKAKGSSHDYKPEIINHVTMFSNGKVIAKKPYDEYGVALLAYMPKPTPKDIQEIMLKA